MTGTGSARAARQAAAVQAWYASDVVGVLSGHGQELHDANDEALRILGREREDLTGTILWSAVFGALRTDRAVGLAAGADHDGSTATIETVDHPDGSQSSVLVVAAVTGRDPPSWLALLVELTDHEVLRRAATADALVVSTLLDDAPIGFAFIDPQLRFVRVNRELAAMNGHPAAAHEGRYVFDVVPELEARARPLLEHVLATGQEIRDLELTGTTDADPGVTHTWLESYFPVRLPHGPVVGVAAIAQDQTLLSGLRADLAERVREQREALQVLQRAMLPPTLPRFIGAELHAAYQPANDLVHLGGDWYDVVATDPSRIAVVVGDAVGHGLSAVETMARASGAVRAYLHEGLDPGQVLRLTNRLLRRSAPDRAAAVAIACLDTTTGHLQYAAAGLPYPLLIGASGPQLQRAGRGPMLGVIEDPHYAVAGIDLALGATLLLYTDGLIERRGELLRVGFDRLTAAFTAPGSTTGPADVVRSALRACLNAYTPDDDVCALAMTRTPIDTHGMGGRHSPPDRSPRSGPAHSCTA